MSEADDRPTLNVGLADEEDTAVEGKQLGPGTNVGGYLVEGIIGSGGMGVVYIATHPIIGKRAAIKVLKPELSHEPAAVERFVTEARSVNQIGHRNIVDIFDFGALPDGRHFYLMDLLEGESLRARLRRTGALHVSEAASIIDEIADALMAAHAKGIVHRDLKPDNVFMLNVPGRWPEVRVLDWGLAKLLSPGGAKFRTATGSVLGTPVYMSPEQARASDLVDARTDIYALGVLSFELLSGRVPFHKQSSIDTLLAHQEDKIPSLALRVPGLPEELVQLIEAMLAKEPPGRPTLAAVRTVLKRLKGTKIPTLSVAGIEMSVPPSIADKPVEVHSRFDELATIDIHRPKPTEPPLAPRTITGMRAPAPPRMQSPPLDSQYSGAPLPPVPSIAPRAEPSPAMSFPEIQISYESMPNIPRAQTPVPAPKKNRSGLVIIVVAIVLIAIGVAVYAFAT